MQQQQQEYKPYAVKNINTKIKKNRIKNKNSNKIINKSANKVINKLIKKTSRLSINRPIRTSSYMLSLMNPEINMFAKAPSNYGNLSIPLHRKISLQVNTNSSGNLGIVYQPFNLLDNTTSAVDGTLALSGYSVTGGATAGVYNPVTASSTFTFNNFSQQVTAGTVASYRLVSACITIKPANNMLNLSGLIIGGFNQGYQINNNAITTTATANPTVKSGSTSDAQTNVLTAAINDFDYFAQADMSLGEYFRSIWVPTDVHDYQFYPINDQDGQEILNQTEGTWYISVINCLNSGNATPLCIVIYQNFEVTPVGGSTISGMSTPNDVSGDASKIVTTLKKQPGAICHAMRSGVSLPRLK
jgi:hypothetical protein